MPSQPRQAQGLVWPAGERFLPGDHRFAAFEWPVNVHTFRHGLDIARRLENLVAGVHVRKVGAGCLSLIEATISSRIDRSMVTVRLSDMPSNVKANQRLFFWRLRHSTGLLDHLSSSAP